MTLRCLIVDNDPHFLALSVKMFEERFEDAGAPATFVGVPSHSEARRTLKAAGTRAFDLVVTDMLFDPLDKPDAPPDEHVALGVDVIRDAKAHGVGFVVGYTKSGEARYAALHAAARRADVDYFCSRYELSAPKDESVISDIVQRIQKSTTEVRLVPRDVDPTRVAVVHGANNESRAAMFRFLRSLGLRPTEFRTAISWTDEATPPLTAILDELFARTQAVVVLLTPDECVRLHPQIASARGGDEHGLQARPNVYFELGMAWCLNRQRTILVRMGRTRTPSDLTGLHHLDLRNDAVSRDRFVQRLADAGCAVERSDAMYDEGDFDGSIDGFTDSMC